MPDINAQFGVSTRVSVPIGTLSVSVGFIGDNNGNRGIEFTIGYGINTSTDVKNKGISFCPPGPFIGLYQGNAQAWNGPGANTGGSNPAVGVDVPESGDLKGIQFSTGGAGKEVHVEKTNTKIFWLPKPKDPNDPWLIQ